MIFAADQTNSANRNAAYAKTGRRGAADMDATVYDLVFIYLIGGALVFCMYAFFRGINI